MRLHDAINQSSTARSTVLEILKSLRKNNSAAQISSLTGIPNGTVTRWLVLLRETGWASSFAQAWPQKANAWYITAAGLQALNNLSVVVEDRSNQNLKTEKTPSRGARGTHMEKL